MHVRRCKKGNRTIFDWLKVVLYKIIELGESWKSGKDKKNKKNTISWTLLLSVKDLKRTEDSQKFELCI